MAKRRKERWDIGCRVAVLLVATGIVVESQVWLLLLARVVSVSLLLCVVLVQDQDYCRASASYLYRCIAVSCFRTTGDSCQDIVVGVALEGTLWSEVSKAAKEC